MWGISSNTEVRLISKVCPPAVTVPAPEIGTIAVSSSGRVDVWVSPASNSTTAKLKKSHPALSGVMSMRTEPSGLRARWWAKSVLRIGPTGRA